MLDADKRLNKKGQKRLKEKRGESSLATDDKLSIKNANKLITANLT